MYAAAGGASLASRQARQRQRQEKKNKQLQAKLHPPKAAGIGAGLGAADHGGASTPTRSQSRQFHQLPTSYLRAPQPQGRKLSATYTQSRSLLPIEEAGSDTQSVLQLRMHSHAHGHAHTPGSTLAGHGHGHSHLHHSHMHGGPPQTPYQQFASSHGRVSPKLVHRHSGSGSSAGFPLPAAVGGGAYPAHSPGGQLHKSATATLPLVSQMEPTPPTTPAALPSAAVGVKTTATSLETDHASTSAAAAAAAAAAAEAAAELQLTGASAAAMFAAPHHDAIIVTPATPMASPGHVAAASAAAGAAAATVKLDDDDDDELAEAAERQPLTSYDDEDDEAMQPPSGPLERKCSVYRMRRSDGFADGGVAGAAGGLKRQLRELQFQTQTQYEPLVSDEPQLLFKGLGNGRKWQVCAYCEEGICVCEHLEAALMLRSKSRVARRRKLRKLGGRLELPSNVATKEIAPFPRYPPESWKNTYVTTPPAPQPEPPPPPPECAQGRAAWLERGRRCSVQEQQQQQATCHRRWVKRNRIQDASLGGSSDDEDFLGVLRGPSTFANAFLYVGLGTVALGLVIAFVGTGEKGFKTVELRLIGPSLIVLGLICCILRILFCICPSHCISSSKKTRKKNGNKIDADHTTSLLRNESKRVSIARGPAMQPKYPIAHKRSQSKMLNEGMEALRQIATTSLFMQNEQKTAINRVVPIINEPESMDHMGADAPLEMKKLQTALNLCEMSDEEREEDEEPLQLAKRTTATTTTAVTSSTTKATTATPTTAKATTTLSTVDEKPNSSSSSSSSKLQRQRVALQQQRQQQQQLQQQQQQQQQQLPEQSQSLSSSSTVRDSLDGVVVVEETSLIDAELAAPLPSSCSTGAIPRLKSRPGISTGATPKTMPTTTTSSSSITSSSISTSNPTGSGPSNTARLTSSQSHPTSYDLPPAQPHTYSAAATVRGPLGMTLTGSTSVYAMPATRPHAATPSTTTISLLPLPAPPPKPITTATVTASIPGQVPETVASACSSSSSTYSAFASHKATAAASGMATTSLSILQPASLLQQRPATAAGTFTATAAAASIFGGDHKSQPSSAGAMGRGSGSVALLAPPPPPNKFEPELVLSPAKLGQ